MKYFGGCDVGSTYAKCVILDENGKIIADATVRSKINPVKSAEQMCIRDRYKTGERLEGLMSQFVGIIGTFVSMGVTYLIQTIIMQKASVRQQRTTAARKTDPSPDGGERRRDKQ